MISRFPGVPADEWPIHEFTCLCPERCRGTTSAERLGWVKAYWGAADPDYVDGPGAESFAAFLGHVQGAVDGLALLAQQGAGQVALFWHGQFIQAMRWLMGESGVPVNQNFMRVFRQLDRANPVRNCISIVVRYDEQMWRLA